MKTFKVDAKKMNDDIIKCKSCDECYVEQIWKEIGEDHYCHCEDTRKAFHEALCEAMSVHKIGIDNLPGKDNYVCIKTKNGKRICAKLHYDEEGKPCMFYDDFDNWYSINDVESWMLISMNNAGKLTIKVKE